MPYHDFTGKHGKFHVLALAERTATRLPAFQLLDAPEERFPIANSGNPVLFIGNPIKIQCRFDRAVHRAGAHRIAIGVDLNIVIATE